MECRVKNNQLGARGDDVIALVGFHKAHVNITLRFSSWKTQAKENLGGEISRGISNEGWGKYVHIG